MSLRRLQRLEERLERRRRISFVPRTRLRDRLNPLQFYNSEQFKLRFHMFKDTAIFITTLIESRLVPAVKRGCQLPPIIQFLIVVRFYATGSFQISVGDLHTISQSTVSNLVRRVSTAIASHCRTFVKFPTHEAAVKIRENFYKIAQFPGVVGALDCTHVKIDSPGGDTAELFRNRKGYFSINVQAVCDSDLMFTNVVSRWYGSAHDTRIFDNSSLMADLESQRAPGIILGDSGYPLLPYLMTPLLRPNTRAEKRYNVSQIASRNVIERAFGVLKRRFPCLQHLRLKLKTCLTVVVATFVLHNILRSRRDIFEEDRFEPQETGHIHSGSNNCQSGKRAQQNIVNNSFS